MRSAVIANWRRRSTASFSTLSSAPHWSFRNPPFEPRSHNPFSFQPPDAQRPSTPYRSTIPINTNIDIVSLFRPSWHAKVAPQLFSASTSLQSPARRPRSALTPLFATHARKRASFTCHTFFNKMRLPVVSRLERFQSLSPSVVPLTIPHVRCAVAHPRNRRPHGFARLFQSCARHPRGCKPYLNPFLKTMSKLYCKDPSPTC
jgi:hypothetical protein